MNTKRRIITSGSFTEAGNFTGYTLTGERIHIPKQLMESAGFNADTLPKFPLYAVVVERTFNKVDAEGVPTEETFTRDQAGSIFTDEDSLIKAINSERLLDVKAEIAFKASASAIGLSTVELDSLVEAGL